MQTCEYGRCDEVIWAHDPDCACGKSVRCSEHIHAPCPRCHPPEFDAEIDSDEDEEEPGEGNERDEEDEEDEEDDDEGDDRYAHHPEDDEDGLSPHQVCFIGCWTLTN